MNITLSNNSNLNFGITSKVRIPMKNGTTTLLKVTGEKNNKGKPIYTDIIGDIMQKGKVIGQTKEYHNKNGFKDERFAVICEELSQGAKEPDTVMDKIMDSIQHPNIDLNA